MLRKHALINLAFAVPKNRKPKFDLTLRIIDLTNIPLIAGTVTVRWHLSSSTTADHRGRTPSAPISEHKATWEYVKTLPVRLTIDKNGHLQECDIHFEVLQEFHDGGRGGRVHLGNVKLNLAEYTQVPDVGPERDPQDEGEEEGSITRRYLLQDSKINSTLKIGILMRQTEGDMNFIAPPLKSAMVVGGIAGVLTTEAGVLGGGGGANGEDMPSITSKTRELAEAQDIYRRTLAATWACQAGELAPDRLIENLFAGGDGGRPPSSPHKATSSRHPNPARLGRREESRNSSSSDEPHHRHAPAHTNPSQQRSHPPSTPRPSLLPPQTFLTPQMATAPGASPQQPHGHQRGTSRDSPGPSSVTGSLNLSSTQTPGPAGPGAAVSGRSSIDQQVQQSQAEHGNRRRGLAEQKEYTEFELRDDLRSWSVRVR
ncbi:hypothetical protein A1O7_00650 [Cladophialophora yegresii CBS 114405]|uniref:C2 NT-type domain-containing protein n=1 Tax=Cladophialophora yegresii CBS 114405 TaxID=1182544 RepID=W9X1F3_9EURO|nr:uncharacterized protein A1O7_00650 [Cladophialophora yegresii CBS 114405]EXJ64314.1 hypothetical protein A1O7_00650 [Cladophialophora yegresii CBS 114405]